MRRWGFRNKTWGTKLDVVDLWEEQGCLTMEQNVAHAPVFFRSRGSLERAFISSSEAQFLVILGA